METYFVKSSGGENMLKHIGPISEIVYRVVIDGKDLIIAETHTGFQKFELDEYCNGHNLVISGDE